MMILYLVICFGVAVILLLLAPAIGQLIDGDDDQWT